MHASGNFRPAIASTALTPRLLVMRMGLWGSFFLAESVPVRAKVMVCRATGWENFVELTMTR